MEKTVVKSKNIFARIFQYFKTLSPLVLMQLKDKLDLSFLKSKKKTLFKIIYSILLFVGLTAIIWFIFNLIVNLSLFSLLKILNFRAFLVLMTVLMILSFLSCLTNITKTLYFSKDNSVLLTMPVTTNQLFTSKLIVVLIYELIKNNTYILPFLIAYGLIMKLSFAYFLWVILSVLIFTLLVVIISGLCSIFAMGFVISLKKNKVIEIILSSLVVGVFVYALVRLISVIPSNIDLIRDWGKIYWTIQDFLKDFASAFIIFNYLLEFMTGMKFNSFAFNISDITNLYTFLVILGTIIVGLTLSYLLLKKLFLKMASSPFEYKKTISTKQYHNKKIKPFWSCVLEETKKLFRTPDLLYTNLSVAIICPIAIFLQNQIVSAMDTRILGNNMTLAFNVLIILLMILSNGSNLASIYSKEGNSAYLNKVNPVDYKIPLTAKLFPFIVISCLSIIASTFVISLYSNISATNLILLTLAMIFVYVGHAFWSAEMDIMNPQNAQYQTTGTHHKNPNETKSIILTFIVSIIFAFACYFLINENIGVVFIKLFAIGLIFMLARTTLFYTRIKLYYEEK